MARLAHRLPLLLAALAALVAAPVLAGCVGSAQAASAKQNLSPADEAAKAWDPGAKLAQVVGAEGTMGLFAAAFAAASSKDLAASDADEAVGDGRCEVWVYRYVAAGKGESYVVVLDKEGNVLRKGAEAKHEDDKPLGAWSLDSDEAMALALKANEGLRQGVQGKYFGVVSVLHQEGAGNPVWLVAGGGGDALGGGGGHVVVDAVSGKVLASEGGFGSR